MWTSCGTSSTGTRAPNDAVAHTVSVADDLIDQATAVPIPDDFPPWA